MIVAGAWQMRRRLGVQLLVVFFCCGLASSQSDTSSEKAFSQSKAAIELALKKLQSSMAGRLPVLDGFVAPSDQALDRYRRAYFQTAAQVSSVSAGSSIVRASAKITAWYTDPAGTHSGYRVLPSNGRLEADLLEQLSEELGKDELGKDEAGKTEPVPPATASPATRVVTPFPPSLGPSLPTREQAVSSSKSPNQELEAEIKSLQEVLHNQGHPNNLVAVKQSGTAVVASPSMTAKTLFLASVHDEFEMLDFNADWVHVRISGLSRGWIWRNSLEMPEGIPDTASRAGSGAAAVAEQLFHVTREETAAFPGNWQPLRGKTVRIVSIEKVDEKAPEAGVTMRLEFAKSILEKNYADLAKKTDEVAGIVMIFDSSDGGMIASTITALQRWKAGALSDSAFWRQCFFDPPEMLEGGASATQ